MCQANAFYNPRCTASCSAMNGKLARSDQIAAKKEGPNAAAGPLAQGVGFDAPTKELFIDYNF
jgi:hypothetical protein